MLFMQNRWFKNRIRHDIFLVHMIGMHKVVIAENLVIIPGGLPIFHQSILIDGIDIGGGYDKKSYTLSTCFINPKKAEETGILCSNN
jgi:uncharacterized protein GlcG (DUF336 family)